MTKLFQKIINEGKYLFGQLVTHILLYLTKGTFVTSKEFYQANRISALYSTLFPNLVTCLKVPEQLYKALSPNKVYDIDVADAPCGLAVKTNYYVAKVLKGCVYTDNAGTIAVKGEDKKIRNDVCFQFNSGKSGIVPVNAVFNQTYFKEPVSLAIITKPGEQEAIAVDIDKLKQALQGMLAARPNLSQLT